jgi:drug/metabolite transporter (DMT)-like permease
VINIFIAFGLMASATSVNKIILYSMAPALLVGIRMFIAGLILLTYTFLHSKHRLTWGNVKQNLLLLLVITLSTTYIPSLLKAYALKNMASSKAAFFGTLDPFVTAIYAYFLCNEKVTLKKSLGIVIGFLGACILLASTSPLEEQLRVFAFISYPEIAALLAVVIGRYGWIKIQDLLKKNIYSPAQINTLTMLISGLLSLTTAWGYGELGVKPLNNAPLALLQTWPLEYVSSSWQLFLFLSYTILIGNVISYNLFARMLKQYSITFISLTGFSIPLFVHLYGWLFLSEYLSLNFFISCAVTFLGSWIFFQDERATRIC